jgi:hypothetical protein
VVNRPGRFSLFASSKPPQRSSCQHVEWLTWSPAFRHFVARYERELRTISRPALINVRGCEPYESTYDVPLRRLLWLPERDLRTLARALAAIAPGRNMLVLDRLMDHEIDSGLLLSLFVLFRACLVDASGNPSQAMSRPVNRVARDLGFPLHADLFVHRRLLIVFDDVADHGGASLFLSTSVLTRLLRENHACPARVRIRVATLLRDRLPIDRFDEFFDLLHNHRHPWVPELEERMAEHQLMLPLRRGQGYLIDDRAWLHGRMPSDIPVRSGRFRRLAF